MGDRGGCNLQGFLVRGPTLTIRTTNHRGSITEVVINRALLPSTTGRRIRWSFSISTDDGKVFWITREYYWDSGRANATEDGCRIC
jgi:hypothetical protein